MSLGGFAFILGFQVDYVDALYNISYPQECEHTHEQSQETVIIRGKNKKKDSEKKNRLLLVKDFRFHVFNFDLST